MRVFSITRIGFFMTRDFMADNDLSVYFFNRRLIGVFSGFVLGETSWWLIIGILSKILKIGVAE